MWGDGKQELKTYLNLHMKTKKQKKLCPAINSICCCVGRWQTRKIELIKLENKKKKKNYTDALSFQCQDHHGLK